MALLLEECDLRVIMSPFWFGGRKNYQSNKTEKREYSSVSEALQRLQDRRGFVKRDCATVTSAHGKDYSNFASEEDTKYMTMIKSCRGELVTGQLSLGGKKCQ